MPKVTPIHGRTSLLGQLSCLLSLRRGLNFAWWEANWKPASNPFEPGFFLHLKCFTHLIQLSCMVFWEDLFLPIRLLGPINQHSLGPPGSGWQSSKDLPSTNLVRPTANKGLLIWWELFLLFSRVDRLGGESKNLARYTFWAKLVLRAWIVGRKGKLSPWQKRGSQTASVQQIEGFGVTESWAFPLREIEIFTLYFRNHLIFWKYRGLLSKKSSFLALFGVQ